MANRNVADDASNPNKTNLANGDAFLFRDSESNPNSLKEVAYSVVKGILDLLYAPIAKGVTNGDSHDHHGGDGALVAYPSQRVRGTVANPNGYYTNVRAQIPLFRADAAITITRIHIHGADLAPTSEMALDLKFADDLNTGGFANATVIDVCDTTNGVFTATGSFDDATVPDGKYVYWQFDSAPHTDHKDMWFEIYFTYD